MGNHTHSLGMTSASLLHHKQRPGRCQGVGLPLHHGGDFGDFYSVRRGRCGTSRPRVERSVAELAVVTQKHGFDVGLSRTLVLKHEQDATALFISTRILPNAYLISGNMLKIILLQHALAERSYGVGNSVQGNTNQSGNFSAASVAAVHAGAGAGAESGVTNFVAFVSSGESVDEHTSETTTQPISTTWEDSLGVGMRGKGTVNTNHVMVKCMFVVFNEQTTLSSEVAVLQRRETTTRDCLDESEPTIACLTASSIFIYQKTDRSRCKKGVKMCLD
ncbi:hypothetical protein TraAM80_09841 [Trypanosoma rangeli]|uniref:Uncharacterized protein n=1 Tax=Trypanosoma rangeli TaxID=5698 RepID=A0A422MT27_TRYRA|nr:uncharacterized protein TraAM80_09841 [Trypanosoma rangeli]RNE96359.1 hypothetical protein TraAM80_09841 [Trypanosoma rangeli]|eukprot:RNE96359.1 hypothetical protein TraAM80_09841 [Trypanosoma rangeli]